MSNSGSARRSSGVGAFMRPLRSRCLPRRRAGRTPCCLVPTTSGRRGCPRRAPRRGCTARSRCSGRSGREGRCTARRSGSGNSRCRPAPVGERAQLGAAGLVDGLALDRGALSRLLAGQPGDPRAAPGEHAAERLDLAQRAARLPQLDALAHGIGAVSADEGLITAWPSPPHFFSGRSNQARPHRDRLPLSIICACSVAEKRFFNCLSPVFKAHSPSALQAKSARPLGQVAMVRYARSSSLATRARLPPTSHRSPGDSLQRAQCWALRSCGDDPIRRARRRFR